MKTYKKEFEELFPFMDIKREPGGFTYTELIIITLIYIIPHKFIKGNLPISGFKKI
jgi:hypothetical protein